MIRVLLWDEDSFVLACMRESLAAQPDIEVVGEARTVGDMRRLVESHQPDVLVMDALLPDANVFDVVHDLKARADSPKFLIVSILGNVNVVRKIRDAGVHGYLLRSEDVSLLPDAVHQAAQGCRWISPEMTRRVSEQPPSACVVSELSSRELEVLLLMAEGLNNAQIAERLSITAGTVKNHIANLYCKLGVCNERAAVAFAWRNGLLRLS